MSDEHVRSDIRKYLSSNIDTRIALIHQEIWVNNNSSAAVFRMMNNIADVPDRMSAPALLVVGPGGSGKTAIISKIPNHVKRSAGLIFVSLAASPEIDTKKSLKDEIALALGIPVGSGSSRRSSSDLPSEIREVIRLRQIWGLVID